MKLSEQMAVTIAVTLPLALQQEALGESKDKKTRH